MINAMRLNDVVNRMRVESLDGSGSDGGPSAGAGVFSFNAVWAAGTDTITIDKTYAEFKEAYDEGLPFVCSNTICSAYMTHDETNPSIEPWVAINIIGITFTVLSVGGFVLKSDDTIIKQFEAVINIDEFKTDV